MTTDEKINFSKLNTVSEEEYCTSCKSIKTHQVKYQTMADGKPWRRGLCTGCGQVRSLPLNNKPLEDEVIHFGKHKAQKLINIPVDYLQWAVDNANLGHSQKQRFQAAIEFQKKKT